MGGEEFQAAVAKLLADVEKLREQRRLYHAAHPAVIGTHDAIRQDVKGVGRRKIDLGFEHGEVLLDGRLLFLKEDAPARRLVTLLVDLDLAGVLLHFPEAADGLILLAGRLARCPHPPSPDDRAALLALAEELPGVTLVGQQTRASQPTPPAAAAAVTEAWAAEPEPRVPAVVEAPVPQPVLERDRFSHELRAAAPRLPIPSAELLQSLDENGVRMHLVRILGEAVALWPDQTVAEAAAIRLAEELASALALGDLENATRLAGLVAAVRNERARQVAASEGARAAIRAFASLPAEHHATVGAILVSLGERGLPAIIEGVVEAEDRAVRKRLLESIVKVGEGAIPFVRPLLGDQRWYVVRNAVFLLRRLGDRDIARSLKSRIPGARPQVLAEILKALVALQDPDWMTLLLREVDSSNGERRSVALEVASHIPSAALVEALVERIQSRLANAARDPLVTDVVRVFGRLRDPAALPILRELAETQQGRSAEALALRREAALAIVQLKGDDARALAAVLAGDSDPSVAAAVRAALRREQKAEVRA